ncbi:carboxypeptidase regulatory-like domain-containing protein [Rubrivirga sp.]|uniref:carboxypeptidase regulatory-like domain-containing protein n=1 Tax=Rubrivirga sp. TaxID=1885344 RepID=UPI003C785952
MRALLCFVVLALSPLASAQDGVSDFIVGVQTPEGEPVVGASVLVGAKGASTNADGEATIEDMAPGRYRVRVSFVGRITREIAARLDAPGPWGVIVQLADNPVSLGDVVVEARDLSSSRMASDGFFDRLNLGAGTVLTIEDIERQAPILLTDLVRGSAPGVRVRDGVNGPVATVQTRGAECQMAVYLDGVYYSFASENLDAVSAQDVVAVELYPRTTQVPVQYNRLGESDGCGVILVWTQLGMAERR